MKLFLKRSLAIMMALTLVVGMVLDSSINVLASENDSQFENVDLLIYRADLCVAEDSVCSRAINSIITCDNPTKLLVDSAKSNSGFEEGVATWKTLHLLTKPSEATEDVVDEKGYYEALILSLFITQMTNEDYLTRITKQVVGDTNKILSATKTLVSGSDELDRLLVSTNSYINTVPLEDQLKLRDYLKSSFETAHPDLAATTEAVSVVKDIVDSAKTVEEAITRMANYGSLCELGDSTKNVITAMYNECPSSNPALKSALFEASMSVEDFNSGIKATILNATEEQMVSLTGTAIDEGWNWVINLNPSVKAFMAGAKLGTFVGDTVCNALLSTDKTIEQYFKITCLLEIDKVAKSVLRQMENNYKSDRTNLNAQNYLEAVETVFKISYISCDLAEEFAKIIYVDSTAGWLITILSQEGFSKYDKFVKQVRNIKNSYTNQHDSLWISYLNNLEVDYPEIYKELMGIVDPVPVTGISFSNTEMNIVNDDSYFPMIEIPVVSPSNATNKKVTYESSDTSILQIDSEGGWMFPNKTGSVTVTATTEDGGFSASIVVNVQDKEAGEDVYDPLKDYDYEIVDNNYIKITKYNGKDQYIIIPSELVVEEVRYPVKQIGEKGNRVFESSGVISVVMPDSVEKVYTNAFSGISTLENVSFGASLREIGDSAFSGCVAIKNVSIPQSCEQIKYGAFRGCTNLSDVSIKNSWTVVERNAFENTAWTKDKDYLVENGILILAKYHDNIGEEYTVPDGIVNIAGGAISFENLHGPYMLKKVIIPDTVEIIGDYGCFDYDKVDEFVIGSGLRYIGKDAIVAEKSYHVDENNNYFCSQDGVLYNKDMSELVRYPIWRTKTGWTGTEYIIPEGVKKICRSAFQNCISVAWVKFPSTLEIIEDYAFGDSSIRDVEFPEGLKSIGKHAFYRVNMNDGTSIIIFPEGLKSIGDEAFYWLAGKEEYVFKGDPEYMGVACLGVNNAGYKNDAIVYGKKGGIVEQACIGTGISFCDIGTYNKEKPNEYIYNLGIEISNTKLNLMKDDFYRLEASILPVNSTNKKVLWSSSNTDVASVSMEGQVFALAEGTSIITATAAGGGQSVSCEVVVGKQESVTGITLNKSTLTMKKGKTELLEAFVIPENAVNKAVGWMSSDSSVATVNEIGLVTAIKEGTATITAITKDGGYSSLCTIKVEGDEAGENNNPQDEESGSQNGGESGSGSTGSNGSGDGNSGVVGGGGASGSQSQGGSIGSNQEKPSGDSANKENTKIVTNPDGSTTTVTNETKEDGTIVRTEEITKKDGTKKTSVTETKADGTTKVITTAFDGTGKTTSVVEKTTLQTLGNGKDVVITVKRNGNGKVTSAKSSVNILGKNRKATIDGNIVKGITDAAGTDTDITMTVKDGKGDTLYKLTVNSSDLESGNSMKVFKYGAKKGYVLVNAKTYKVSDSGDVSISLKDKGTYRLEDTKTAAKIEKQILASIKLAKPSVKVKNGKSIKVALSETFNKENAKSITFSTLDKKILNVSKNGIVKALTKGSTDVCAKVVLKNGKIKTVKMKVTVN